MYYVVGTGQGWSCVGGNYKGHTGLVFTEKTSAGITISPDGLTVTTPHDDWQAARVVQTLSPSGLYYFEVLMGANVTGATNDPFLGIIKAEDVLATGTGYDNVGYTIFGIKNGSPFYYVNGGASITGGAYGISMVAGDIFRVAINFNTGKMWVGKNSNDWFGTTSTNGNPCAGINPAIYNIPTGINWEIVRFGTSSGADRTTTYNFGDSAFTYSVP